MAEREIIVMGVGNYGTLVAAQWANGTTQFDVAHSTLYTSAHRSSVYGGQGGGSRRRVPRLVLLDAPHATRLETVERMAQLEEASDDGSEPPAFSAGEGDDGEIAWDSGRGERDDPWRRLGSRVVHRDPAQWRAQVNAMEEDEEEEEGKDPSRNLESAKRTVFRQVDYCVPWWHYISSGISKRSLVTLPPSSTSTTVGDIPSTHSFGYGLECLSPSQPGSPMELFADNLRHQVEAADALQGLQCFVDGDSMFGGAAYHTLNAFWDDIAGSKSSAVIFSAFQPLPPCVVDENESFSGLRLQERDLNRLLATSMLSSHTAAVYLPLELEYWERFFAGKDEQAAEVSSLPWVEDDRATAQYIAAMADTALYGARDGSSSGNGPAFSMQEWCRTIRPTSSLRVASLLGAMPLCLQKEGLSRSQEPSSLDLWDWMQATPLLGPTSAAATFALRSREGEEFPQLPPGGQFWPLSHSMPFSPLEERGRVLGHAVGLRGPGALKSQHYPATECLLRYALELRTSTFLPLITETRLPLSYSFPLPLIVPDIPEDQQQSVKDQLEGVDVAAHVCNTYAADRMIGRILTRAETTLSSRRAFGGHHQRLYGMSGDEWEEVLEDVRGLYDEYHHASYESDEDQDDDIE